MKRLMRGIVLFTQRFFQDENKRLHMKKSMVQSREDQIMKKKSTVYQLTTCALMAALMCILGPNSVPIGPVPVSLTNLVIYLAVYLLGTKGSTISYIVYLFLGMVGLPVFSGYEGGFGKLAGPTGGYLIGFILMAIVCGIFMEKSFADYIRDDYLNEKEQDKANKAIMERKRLNGRISIAIKFSVKIAADKVLHSII